MKQAKEPFQFVTAPYMMRICPDRARTLGEFARNLHSGQVASIFHRTFQSLEKQYYAGFSIDFAPWTIAWRNEAALAERLAAIKTSPDNQC
jgi:hypothetical protein